MEGGINIRCRNSGNVERIIIISNGLLLIIIIIIIIVVIEIYYEIIIQSIIAICKIDNGFFFISVFWDFSDF